MIDVQVKTPSSLGFGMQGMGAAVLGYVDQVAEMFPEVTYVEIGVGYAITLAAIAYRLRARCDKWRAIGVELPNNYNRKQIEKQAALNGLEVKPIQHFHQPVNPQWNRLSIVLRNSQQFLGENFAPEGPVHMALIDGCHGKSCATMDFLLLEPMIAPKGIVMFHDFGEDQIGQYQPHCGSLDVRGACKDLALLDNNRPGWKFVDCIIGDKNAGSGDMGVFQKVEL